MVARTTYVSGMVKDVGSNVKVIKKGDVIFAPAAFGKHIDPSDLAWRRCFDLCAG